MVNATVNTARACRRQ